ncbi:MAG: baseplate J/gp47 family protein [Spirochaetes bacterium]|nr:baseplate J/gp47 family protein [Spirochaetota bacterium]
MAESWIDLTDEEREEKIYNLAKDETGITNFNTNGVLKGFILVLVKIVNIIYQTVSDLLEQISLDNATGLFLDLWGLLCGEKRVAANKAKRIFIGTPYSSGQIAIGNWIIVEGTELRFKVTEEVNFDGVDDFEIPVEAEFEGIEYNISNNYTIRFSKVINGLDNVYIPEGDQYLLEAGREKEEDDSYRLRIKSKWLSLGSESPSAKYEYIARSIIGVSDVKIIRCPRGSGSVDVIIACENGTNEEEVRQNVINAIGLKIGVARDVRVIFAIELPVTLNITFSGNSSIETVRTQCEEFFRIKKIGISKTIASLYSFLFENENLDFSSLVILPNNDFSAGIYEVLIFDSNSIINKV